MLTLPLRRPPGFCTFLWFCQALMLLTQRPVTEAACLFPLKADGSFEVLVCVLRFPRRIAEEHSWRATGHSRPMAVDHSDPIPLPIGWPHASHQRDAVQRDLHHRGNCQLHPPLPLLHRSNLLLRKDRSCPSRWQASSQVGRLLGGLHHPSEGEHGDGGDCGREVL